MARAIFDTGAQSSRGIVFLIAKVNIWQIIRETATPIGFLACCKDKSFLSVPGPVKEALTEPTTWTMVNIMKKYKDAQGFVHNLIKRRRHAYRIECDIKTDDWEMVRITFEQSGYSVHCQKNQPSHVIAYRVKPDREPVSSATAYLI